MAKGLSYRQTGVDIDVADADMLRTFNMVVGMALVVAPTAVDAIRTKLADTNCDSYVIGKPSAHPLQTPPTPASAPPAATSASCARAAARPFTSAAGRPPIPPSPATPVCPCRPVPATNRAKSPDM